MNTLQAKKWRPGGKTIVERPVSDVDQQLQAAASRTWAYSRENSRPGGRHPVHILRETAGPASRRQQERDDVLERIRQQSEEIDASQQKSFELLSKARRQFTGIARDQRQLELVEQGMKYRNQMRV